MPLPDTPQSLLLLCVTYSKLFPTHFGLTRNNSKCFVSGPDFSRTDCKNTKKLWNHRHFCTKNSNKEVTFNGFFKFTEKKGRKYDR